MFTEKHLYMQPEEIFLEEAVNAFYGEFGQEEVASCIAGFIEGVRFMLKREAFTDEEKINEFITELANNFFYEQDDFRFCDHFWRYKK